MARCRLSGALGELASDLARTAEIVDEVVRMTDILEHFAETALRATGNSLSTSENPPSRCQ